MAQRDTLSRRLSWADAARYLVWRLEPAQQALFASVGIPPVARAPALHGSFWPMNGMDIAAADLFVPGWMWPQVYGVSDMYTLLQKATRDPDALAQGLHQTTQAMNAAVLGTGPR
jgi:hypothetical protein